MAGASGTSTGHAAATPVQCQDLPTTPKQAPSQGSHSHLHPAQHQGSEPQFSPLHCCVQTVTPSRMERRGESRGCSWG